LHPPWVAGSRDLFAQGVVILLLIETYRKSGETRKIAAWEGEWRILSKLGNEGLNL
jgi:hypothetical protein